MDAHTRSAASLVKSGSPFCFPNSTAPVIYRQIIQQKIGAAHFGLAFVGDNAVFVSQNLIALKITVPTPCAFKSGQNESPLLVGRPRPVGDTPDHAQTRRARLRHGFGVKPQPHPCNRGIGACRGNVSIDTMRERRQKVPTLCERLGQSLKRHAIFGI